MCDREGGREGVRVRESVLGRGRACERARESEQGSMCSTLGTGPLRRPTHVPPPVVGSEMGATERVWVREREGGREGGRE